MVYYPYEMKRVGSKMRQDKNDCVFFVTHRLLKMSNIFLFECSLYDMYRLSLVEKAKRIINNWENLTHLESLSKLFEVAPRALGKYVKEIFLYRRSKLYK